MGLEAITPERVRAAYLERGWKPTQGTFGNESKKCGCMLSLLYGSNAARRLFTEHRPISSHETKDVPVERFWAIAWGFDGSWLPAPYEMFRSEYDLGRACWEAVKDLAVKEVGA